MLNRAERMHSTSGSRALNHRAACSNWSVYTDVMLKDGQFSGFFLVEADIENGIMIDKDGNTGNISIGMQTEVKIVTQKKSIIRYLLEKLDLF